MEQRNDDLQQSIVETRYDIEETRASMNEKLELLEERVRDTLEETKAVVGDIVENVKETVDETVGAVKDTVDGARSTVENIVENVKETMDETVTTVKQSFDLRYQVEHHPWLMLGGSMIAGNILASFMSRGYRTREYSSFAHPRQNGAHVADATSGTGLYTVAGQDHNSVNQENSSSTHKQSGWGSTLGQFQDEFDIVKSTVTGAVMSTVVGTLREMIRQNIPTMASHFDKAAHRVAKKWGAEIDESVPHQEPANR